MPVKTIRLMIVTACWFTITILQAAAQSKSVTFHFYGAVDCPPCMAFKNNALPKVSDIAARENFLVSANVIAKTADVVQVGIYGKTDPILRAAAQHLKIVYPPIFFVSRNDEILSVHGHDWRAALQAARLKARKSAP